MFARTEILLLRPGWAEDAPALARAIAEEAIVRNLASAPWPYDLAHARAFLDTERRPDDDRKRVVSGKSVSVRVDLGGRPLLKNTQKQTPQPTHAHVVRQDIHIHQHVA